MYPTTDGSECIHPDYIKIATSAVASKTIAIVNPHNGPHGASPADELNYQICIHYLQSHSVQVIGYVHTKVGYPDISGYREAADVKADIDYWFS